MKDILNQNLEIGDACVIIVPNYRSLCLGFITAKTPKNVRVQYNHYIYGKSSILQHPSQVLKVEGPAITAHLLSIKS